jgi:hypothetical protein
MAVLTMTASLDNGVMTNPMWFSIGDGLKAFVADFSCPGYATMHFRPHFNGFVWAQANAVADNTTFTAVAENTGAAGILVQVTVATQNAAGRILILGY